VRTTRVYVPARFEVGGQVHLDPATAHYLVRVLRLRPGAPLVLFTGQGGEYDATLVRATHRECAVEVGSFRPREAESPIHICLVQAVSRGERMAYAVQKAVELGVQALVPVVTERCQVQLGDSRAEKRLQHWRGIAVSACQQCGRNRLPELRPLMSLADWLREPTAGCKLVLDPTSTASLGEVPPVDGRAVVVVGPEGGLSESEIEMACTAGYEPVRLGPRILRTETVALAAVSALQALWGDLAGPARANECSRKAKETPEASPKQTGRGAAAGSESAA
jgi:16S rRNA (uracil1498-N3)-methyltransferase